MTPGRMWYAWTGRGKKPSSLEAWMIRTACNDLSDGQRPGSMYCVKERLLRPSVGQSLTVYVPLLFPQKLDHRTKCQEISSLGRKLGIPVWPGDDQSNMSIHRGVLQLY